MCPSVSVSFLSLSIMSCEIHSLLLLLWFVLLLQRGPGAELTGKDIREHSAVMETFYILRRVWFIPVCVCQNSSNYVYP